MESFYNDDHGTYVAWECGSKYVAWTNKEPQFRQTDDCRIRELEQDRDRLAAIVARLPKCWALRDGKLVQDESIDLTEDAWLADPSPHCVRLVTMDRTGIVTTMFHGTPYRHVAPSDLFASREAAEAARNGQPGNKKQ
jgi:hypothetical protein